jgi:hypothetical protein
MPRRDDIRTILIIGSGPIVIGQGCEFDYSGAQACKSLRDEGYRVVLVNSNPATIMTDPAFADRTYIEPVTPDAVRKIIEREATAGTPIDAVLPTLGGQTGPELRLRPVRLGRARRVRHRDDRGRPRGDQQGGGPGRVRRRSAPREPRDARVEDRHDARRRAGVPREIGLPAIIRPAFTLGGWGGGIAYNLEEFDELVTRGIRASMIGPGPGRQVAAGLEGVRARGRPRPQRQLRHRLRHREHRRDGRAHRRLGHRRADPDAHRQGVPGPPRRALAIMRERRRRDGRVERPVRGQPEPADPDGATSSSSSSR